MYCENITKRVSALFLNYKKIYLQDSMEMPQDSLLNIIENDYDVDTSQPITFNSIWNDIEQ